MDTLHTERIHSVEGAFSKKKRQILADLAEPPGERYHDRSPKGSIDQGIKTIVDRINAHPNLVTTSSCSGRISVFLEGARSVSSRLIASNENEPILSGSNSTQKASQGGKGGGGRWMFVSHDPLPLSFENETPSLHFTKLFNLEAELSEGLEPNVPLQDARYVHFKFEPMILHVLAADTYHARHLLTSAQQAGFRESGIMSLPEDASMAKSPIAVAIRTTGLGFDNIVGFLEPSGDESTEVCRALVSERQLQLLVRIANQKFTTNKSRTQALLNTLVKEKPISMEVGMARDKSTHKRRIQKRAEGLRRQQERSRINASVPQTRFSTPDEETSMDLFE